MLCGYALHSEATVKHLPVHACACYTGCAKTVQLGPIHHVLQFTHPQPGDDAGEDAQAVATAVATGLVAAYADLRQLHFLLQSLLDALLAQMPPTAAAVLCVAPFVQALRKVRLTKKCVKLGRGLCLVGVLQQCRSDCPASERNCTPCVCGDFSPQDSR